MNENQSKANFFNGQQLKISVKSVILFVLALIALYTIIPKLAGFKEVGQLILKVNKFYLLLAILTEFISYVGAATLLGIILNRLRKKVPFWDRFRISSIAAFAIHFFPVGSFGEGAVDYYFLTKRKVSTGTVLIMFVLRIIFSYSAFLFLFLFGLVLVPVAPHLPFSPKVVSAILVLLIFSGVIYMIYLYWHKLRFRRSWDKQIGRINKILQILKKRVISNERREEIFEDIYTGIGLFGNKKRSSVFAIFAALLYWLGDIICFFFVFLSFGFHIHFGVLIFSYCVATLAGLISFIPGGIGVTEGILGIVLTGLGVPVSVALTSVLVFRFFSFWIWVPVGLYSFLTLRGSGGKT